ncbi:hypothetical protein [Streptomyces nodosus]|uniref:hypothetical protein n=1 Tax=Streptomyces nodosus TaxID=40318 RepID=UPI00382FE85D
MERIDPVRLMLPLHPWGSARDACSKDVRECRPGAGDVLASQVSGTFLLSGRQLDQFR